MKVLVTGGLGFIGSHTVLELIDDNHEVVIIDDLSNSHFSVLAKLEKITNKNIPFYQIDIKDYHKTKEVFVKEKIDAIIHFAGYKAVGESVSKPLKYYENNLLTTINLANLAEEFKVQKIIFSSSATVYGDQVSPMDENMPLLETTNPYGETKKISERILRDFYHANNNIDIVILRYFNPIGADKSGLIGEVPQGIPNNLMPYITQVASKKREKLFIYGNDYDTKDGTGVRDYIHVTDLAIGHLLSLNNSKKGFNVYNLGSGDGVSVLELVNTFMSENNIEIPYEIVDRRPGDIATVFANPNKAFNELGFKTTKTIKDMVKDSWNFEKNIK